MISDDSPNFAAVKNLYKMQLAELYKKALAFEFLTVEEGMFLFELADRP